MRVLANLANNKYKLECPRCNEEYTLTLDEIREIEEEEKNVAESELDDATFFHTSFEE